HRIGVAHPMERGIAEDRIELACEGEPHAVDDPRIEPLGLGRRHLLGALIDADRLAERRELGRQRAIAAAEIENPLARPRREPLEHALPQSRHEARIAAIALWVPMLRRGFGGMLVQSNTSLSLVSSRAGWNSAVRPSTARLRSRSGSRSG